MTTNTFRAAAEIPAWLWTLSPARQLAVFDAEGRKAVQVRSVYEYYWMQLRSMALQLIVEAPAGPARDTADFLSRFDPHTLAALWGGNSQALVWTGTPGVDHQIAALMCGRQPVLPSLRAEFTNLFRRWAAFPDQLHSAVLAVGPLGATTPSMPSEIQE